MKDHGGWWTFARLFASDAPPIHMDFKWSAPAPIDLIALVPSRYFQASGIDPNYGAPEEFSVHLIDELGVVLPAIATERNWRASRIRAGHPFVYRLAEPISASGMRLKITRMVDFQMDGKHDKLLSWGEVLCFSKDTNIAENSSVSYDFEDPPGDSWVWRKLLLVDGKTPLGLPEKRVREVKHIGWISGGRASCDEPVWLQVDLGRERGINGVRLFPALRPTLDAIPGFGLPVRFRIDVSETGNEDDFHTILDHTSDDQENSGHNPVTCRFPMARTRFVRLVATKLWKPFARYPAFLALSEFQVLNHEENVALDAPVTSSDPTGPIPAHEEMLWSGESLTNGSGPTGELLGTRRWIEALDTRLQLETKLHRLDLEAAAIREQWTRNTNIALTLAAGTGILAAFGIPVFFRIRESRRLREMRNSISGDLHDEIGSNLGSIQVLAGLLKNEYPETREEATTIERVAAETVNSVRDIVWHLRPQTRETAHTVEHLRDTATILLEPAECTLQTDIKGDDLLLDHRERRDLMLFFREVLHNVSRHSKAGRVEIRLGEKAGMFHLSVADNGAGIPERVQNQPGFLRALKERAKRLDGRLEIQSGEMQGTVITLRFPRRTTLRTRVSRFLRKP